jgi:hypothetical protein
MECEAELVFEGLVERLDPLPVPFDIPHGTGVAPVIHRSSNHKGQHTSSARIVLHTKGYTSRSRLL